MRRRITAASIGWVYLWHFSRPLGNLANVRAQAQHYCGYADDPDGDTAGLERRAAEHLAGRGAKITRAAVAAGIEISLVMAWRAPLAFEKQIKARKEAPRLCPICCQARGRAIKHVHPSDAMIQLNLPFDDDDFPAVPPGRADWMEIQLQRSWRATAMTFGAPPDLARLDDLL